MLAGELAKLAGAEVNHPEAELKLSHNGIGITEDSRKVDEGVIFAALEGAKMNGEDFIPDAVVAGAVAILTRKGKKVKGLPSAFVHFTADEPRKAFTLMVKAFYPKAPSNIVAVTGTNGKTSTTVFCRQIWEALGEPAASMGTIGIISKYVNEEGNLTSPPPTLLYPAVDNMARKGVRSLALEASSHGIVQYRLDGLAIKAAGFTNLTRDHLDYHGSMENYFLAKLRLFKEVVEDGGMAVINADIPEANALVGAAKGRGLNILSYGFKGKDLRILNHRMDARGQNLLLEVLGKKYNIRLPLAGDFQALNALCALGLCIGTGANIERAIEALETLKGAWGRLENVVTLSNGAAVYVDYAHTPDAIENVLSVLRPTTKGKLSIVMGCGGDRDRGKRPMMGKIASELADKVFVTDDNPRGEDPSFIRSEIMPACPKGVEITGGRAEAIRLAIAELKAGDVLVLAGKGHETGQKIGDKIYHFNDTEEAVKAALAIDDKAHEGAGANTAIIYTARELAKAADAGAEAKINSDIYGITAVVKDVKPADAFIALDLQAEDGEDGHERVAEAFAKGAAVALVHKSLGVAKDVKNINPERLIVVDDTMNALDNIAKYARFRGKPSPAVLMMMFKNSVADKVEKGLTEALSFLGDTEVIENKKVLPMVAKLGLAGVGERARVIVAELGTTNLKHLGEVSRAMLPDLIIITAEDRAPNLADIFMGANMGAALVIEDSHREAAELIRAAKVYGLRRVVTFGFGEDADIPASRFGDDKVGLILAAVKRAMKK